MVLGSAHTLSWRPAAKHSCPPCLFVAINTTWFAGRGKGLCRDHLCEGALGKPSGTSLQTDSSRQHLQSGPDAHGCVMTQHIHYHQIPNCSVCHTPIYITICGPRLVQNAATSSVNVFHPFLTTL